MEDTLREIIIKLQKQQEYGLNPCFNGRYSQRIIIKKLNKMEKLS